MKNRSRVLIALIMMPDNVAAVGGGDGGGGFQHVCSIERFLMTGAVPVINAQQPQGPNAEICEM